MALVTLSSTTEAQILRTVTVWVLLPAVRTAVFEPIMNSPVAELSARRVVLARRSSFLATDPSAVKSSAALTTAQISRLPVVQLRVIPL